MAQYDPGNRLGLGDELGASSRDLDMPANGQNPIDRVNSHNYGSGGGPGCGCFVLFIAFAAAFGFIAQIAFVIWAILH